MNEATRSLVRLVTTEKIDKRIGHNIMDEWQEILEEEGFPFETVAKQLMAASRFKVKGRIDTDTVPVLILYGNQDQFVPNLNSRRSHKLLPGSELKIVRSGA